MSRRIAIDSQTDKQLKKISDDLQVKQEPSKYAFSQQSTYICLYDTEGDYVYVPFAYNHEYPRPERKELPECIVKFCGELRDNQKEVKKEAITALNKCGSVIIATGCGFGKTITSICISTKLKLKTLIICNRIVLINQWKESIKRFCPQATVHILTTTAKMVNAHFYIINATNVPKHDREFYKYIGTLIIDECHLILAEKLSQCMRYILPRYVIGLSATPYRLDGLNTLFDMYFGQYKIERKFFRKHTVYKVETGFKPETKMNKMGKVDWGTVLESQCGNRERNELIIRLIKYFPDRVFLVLCKRVEQAKYLFNRLVEEKEDATSLIGSKQTYEQSSRILVGSVQKAGIGFDHPRLNAMILASDVEQYFVQYLGRVFRREDTEPIIFDLVDNNPILNKHFRTRNAIYVEHGGVVKNFLKEYPDYKI